MEASRKLVVPYKIPILLLLGEITRNSYILEASKDLQSYIQQLLLFKIQQNWYHNSRNDINSNIIDLREETNKKKKISVFKKNKKLTTNQVISK